jgi:hypothetical protein
LVRSNWSWPLPPVVLTSAHDEELFERAREHVDRDHPDMGLSDEQVRSIVEQGAYDK